MEIRKKNKIISSNYKTYFVKLAHLIEHLVYIQKVTGLTPVFYKKDTFY